MKMVKFFMTLVLEFLCLTFINFPGRSTKTSGKTERSATTAGETTSGGI